MAAVGPAPTRDENDALVEQWRAGDANARDDLITRNMPLAIAIAKRYLSRGVELEDLIQAAALGLVRAAAKFEPGRSAFSTYATYWCRHFCDQLTKRYHPAMTLPLNQDGATARDAIAILNDKLTVPLGDGVSSEELLTGPDPLDNAARNDVVAAVQAAIGFLDQRRREIVLARLRGETLKDIGQRYGISRERVRQIVADSHAELREYLVRFART